MSLLETRLSLYLIYFEVLEEVGRIEMRGLSARWPCKETRNRENESHGGVHSGSRYRAALYAELKGYGEILWGRGRSHASFSAASLPLSVSPGPNKKKKNTQLQTIYLWPTCSSPTSSTYFHPSTASPENFFHGTPV